MPSKTAVCGWVLLAIVTGGAAGCTVRARTVPVGYAEVTSVPVDVYYAYPSTVYEGRLVYYVGGRWLYRDGDRWLSYETEPAPLYRYRTTVQQAPPAPRYESPPRVYRPAEPVPQPAPPATRVR